MGKEKLLLGFYLLGLVINLLLSSLVLPLYPLPGAALAIILTKGVVGLLTVTAAQKRIKFLVAKDLQIAGVAVLIATLIYFASKNLIPRNVMTLLTLLPFFVLWGYWWKEKLKIPQTS
jgi:O-antigen/teichoic acid export membrane protein